MQKMFNDIELLEDKVENYYLKYGGLPIVRDENNEPIEYTYSDISEIIKNEGSNKYIKKIDYIESTGTQYIDTEYYLQSDTVNYEIEFYVSSAPTDCSLFGAEASSSYSGVPYFSSGNLTYWAGKVKGSLGVNPSIGQWHNYIYENNLSQIKAIFDGKESTHSTSNNSLLKTRPIYVFANNINTGVRQFMNTGTRIKSFKITDNGEIVRDFIPVLDENGVACLYDKVKGKYYYNEGKGEFKTNLDEGGTINNEVVIEKGDYHIIDLSAIGNITLNYGKEGYENLNSSDDVYIINEKTHDIYYVKGVEYVDGKFYHSKKVGGDNSEDTIPPTKPEINILSGTKLNEETNVYTSNVEVEIIPGKDKNSGVKNTIYTIKSNEGSKTIETKEITERTVIKLSKSSDYTIIAQTTNNLGQSSIKDTNITISKEISYTEVEYLEVAVKGQYIDTSYYLQSDTVNYEIEFYVSSTPTDCSLFGAEASSSSYSGVPYFSSGNLTYWAGKVKGSLGVNPSIGQWHNYIYENNLSQIKAIFDGKESTHSTSNNSLLKTRPIYVFANNIYTGVRQFMNIGTRIKSFKITDNGKIVRDFIPVLDENNVACLYDKVEGKYYYNAGTGEFKTNLDE